MRIPMRSLVLGVLIFSAVRPSAAEEKPAARKGPPGAEFYQGYVNGIDVIVEPDKSVLCYAYINKQQGSGSDYIQVTTGEGRLQSALETAYVKSAKVEVTYIKDGQMNKLTRVQLLDRGPAKAGKGKRPKG